MEIKHNEWKCNQVQLKDVELKLQPYGKKDRRGDTK